MEKPVCKKRDWVYTLKYIILLIIILWGFSAFVLISMLNTQTLRHEEEIKQISKGWQICHSNGQEFQKVVSLTPFTVECADGKPYFEK